MISSINSHPVHLPLGLDRDVLRRWARYYWHTEVYDRTLPHRIVCGVARVEPRYRRKSSAFARSVLRAQKFFLWSDGPERRHCLRLTHEGVGRLLEELAGGTRWMNKGTSTVSKGAPSVCWVMLNPSTAEPKPYHGDVHPTKCYAWARRPV